MLLRTGLQRTLVLLGGVALGVRLFAAANPSPAYAWQDADTSTILTWTPSAGEVSYNVYFGTVNPPDQTVFRGNQTATSYNPGILAPNTHYYWRIDGVNSSGTVTTGALWHFWTGAGSAGTIDRVALMPNSPSSYSLRDWKQVATDFNSLMTDFSRTGDYLPVPIVQSGSHNFTAPFVFLPSFIGHASDGGALGTMSNVVGASLCGVDKTSDGGYNYVTMQSSYYSIDKDYGVIFHSVDGGPLQSFWYQLIANILFWQLADLYPTTAASVSLPANDGLNYTMEDIMRNSADKWRDVSSVLDGEYAYYGFNFDTNLPDATSGTQMPHSAGGLAWLHYMAYKKFGDPDYLDGADVALEYLHEHTTNPAHDVLLPYGILTAARMNAELGLNYNVAKMMNWHFDIAGSGSVNAHAGVAVGNYGSHAVDGLVGKPGPGLQRVYPANTFMSAGILAPVARYDQRYARDLGKWLVNLASGARLFYSNALGSGNQSSYAWASTYDLDSAVAYEFLGNEGLIVRKATADYQHVHGTVLGADTYQLTYLEDKVYMRLREAVVGGVDRLEHVWTLDLHPGEKHDFKVGGRIVDAGDGDIGFKFSYRKNLTDPWTHLLTFTSTSNFEQSAVFGQNQNLSGTIYIKIEDTNQTSGTALDQMNLDFLLVQTYDTQTTPYLGGGYVGHGGTTNLCLYQSAQVGYLGAIVATTNVSKILKIDLNRTDFFAGSSYPTSLYYNPHTTAQSVQVNVGSSAVDVYDTVQHAFILTGVTGTQSISIPADTARVLVLTPADGTTTVSGRHRLVDGVIVDYYYPTDVRLFADNFESGSLVLGGWTRQNTIAEVKSEAAYEGTRGVKLYKTTWIEKAVSTAGLTDISVKYRRMTTGFDAGDNLIVEWSVDGSTWNTLETVQTAAYGDGLQNRSCGAGAANQSGFRVRFRTTATEAAEHAYVDNVEILGLSD